MSSWQAIIADYHTERPAFSLMLGLGVILSFALILYEFFRRRQRLRGFSGPSGLPIVGNLFQVGNDSAEAYRLWSKVYGDVYQVQLGSIPVLVVNSAAAAKVIFAHNSQATNSRPEFYTFHKIVSDTSGTTIGTAPASESLKRRRKIAASALNKPAVQSYVPQLDMETKVFISELWEIGQAGEIAIDPIPMIQRLNMSLTLTMNWGRRMESSAPELFAEITYVEDEISKFRRTNANLQDYIPLLRLNPFNMDSSRAREMRTRRDKYMNALDAELHRKMEKGLETPCIQVNVLNEGTAQLTKREVTSINVTMLAAGLDTMISASTFAMVCLAARPHIQEAAIKAIREHYSENEPLCPADDDQRCQYIVAFIKEVLRFYTMARLSLPRATTRDMMFDGKLIPSGTVVFLNAWACNHDPVAWGDPEEFRPERWLEDADLQHFTLGVGSRMCIGLHLAYRELYLIFVRLLSSFELQPEGEIDSDPLTGQHDPVALTVQPKPFKVKFVPRNPRALRMALSDTS